MLLETTLSPSALWRVFQAVEQAAARERKVTWGPRTLDVDLLLYDQLVLASPELTIPHPRMMFRRFVMEPAAEIASAMIHPLLGWRLDAIKDHLEQARNYIALFASPRCSTAEFAEFVDRLQTTLAANLFSYNFGEGNAAQVAWNREACLAELRRQANLLSARRWEEADLPSDKLLLSDCWLGQSAVSANAWLPAGDAELVREAWLQAASETLRPKLVVYVTGIESMSAANQLTRDNLDRWHTSALELLTAGHAGPWMQVNLADPSAALTEVTAAALAMR